MIPRKMITFYAGDYEHYARQNETFCWTIDISKIKDTSVVFLNGGKIKTQGSDESQDGAMNRMAHTQACRLEYGYKGAIDSVATVIKQFSQRGGGACPTRLSAIDIIKS
jgi:hypothetical protein